jgi:hypothetical protein
MPRNRQVVREGVVMASEQQRIRAAFKCQDADDSPALSVSEQMKLARRFAVERLMDGGGVNVPYPYEIFQRMGIDHEEASEDWNAFCAVFAFTYRLGFAAGQLVPSLRATSCTKRRA